MYTNITIYILGVVFPFSCGYNLNDGFSFPFTQMYLGKLWLVSYSVVAPGKYIHILPVCYLTENEKLMKWNRLNGLVC